MKLLYYTFCFLCLMVLLLLATESEASKREPLGIRNNNPGNLIQTQIPWKGKIECNSRFECFESPYYGIRAMVKNLLGYQSRYNLDTITKIMERWAPPHENETRTLSRTLCNRVNISCSEPIELRSSVHLKNIIIALIIQENGYNPYDDNLIQEVINELTNPSGNTNDVGRSPDRGVNEAVGYEAGVSTSTAENDDAVASGYRGRERFYSPKYKYALSVDKAYYRFNSGLRCPTPTEVSGNLQPGSARYCGLDAMATRIPVLLKWEKRSVLGADERFGPNPTRHPRYELNSWVILRWVYRGSQ